LYLVKPFGDGVLASVIDGLGHGQEARSASETAVTVLEACGDWPVETLIQRCHDALTNTRGVVMTLARLNVSNGSVTWMAVGNVEAIVLRANAQTHPSPERVILHGGVVGFRLPPLQSRRLTMLPGDLLVMATDGIGAEFHETIMRSDPLQQIADGILKRHFKGNDDALVLVLRYVEHGHK
jgi:negative regulator of sigma-B (phosphoserine phosphatase)